MRALFTFFLTICAARTFSQAIENNELNLNQCIEIALKNNAEVVLKAISSEHSRINLQQERENLLPAVSAGISNGLNFGRSINPQTNTYINDRVAYANPYMSSSVLLFNGLAQQNVIRQYSALYKASRQEEDQLRNELSFKVTLAYLEVLTDQELITAAQASLKTTTQQVERLESLNRAGAISPAEYYDLKGQYAAENLQLLDAENNFNTSKIALFKLLNIPYSPQVKLMPLAAETEDPHIDKTANEMLQTALQHFASVKASAYRLKSSLYQIKANRSALYPSVFFNSGLSSNYSDKASNDYWNQFQNNLSKSLSLSISIPIFRNLKQRNTIKLAVLEYKANETEAQKLHNELQQLIEEALFNLQTALKKQQNLQEQMEAYQEAFRVVEVRFNKGAANSVDYLISKRKLEQAWISVLNNRYDILGKRKLLDYYQGEGMEE